MPKTGPRPKANILPFTGIPQETPTAKLALLRLEGRAAIKRIENERLLGCIARLGSLTGPILELVIRAPDLDPELARAFSNRADKHEALEEAECKPQSEEA